MYLHGHIRAGRDNATKEKLVHAVADAAGLDTHCVQVYIVDVPARQIAEYGQLLPVPGGEAAWRDSIPVELLKRMEVMGR